MAGIYIHIPFCKQKCSYCNFFSLASSRNVDEFSRALVKEIQLQKNYLSGEEIHTIYFGGGTPSLFGKDKLNRLFDALQENFVIDPDAEITLEANPDDLSGVYLRELKSTPVNRLSIGIQSFCDPDLVYLSRIHNGKQSEEAVMRSQDAGFENLSIDLIYGIPTQDEKQLEKNIEKVFQHHIPHLSAYCLTIEPHTILAHLIKKGTQKNTDDDRSVLHYTLLMKKMKAQHFLHYEISNFAKEGCESKHNCSYWKQEKYLGLGPSAHSYNLASRQWNISNITDYIEKISHAEIPSEIEFLSEVQKYNEYVLTSLRTLWGCDLNIIKSSFGQTPYDHFIKQAEKFLQAEKLRKENHIIFLTDQGKFFADGIASELFL